MRQTLFLVTFMFIALGAYSQDSQGKSDKTEEIPLPNNMAALNEQFGEIKRKIAQSEIRIRTLTDYLQSLNDFRSKVNNFDAAKTESTLNELASAINANNNDDRLILENTLVTFFRQLYYYYPQRTADQESPISSGFYERMDDVTKALRDNPIFNLILSSQDSDNQRAVVDNKKLQQLKTRLSPTVLSDIKTKLTAVVDAEILQAQNNLETAKTELQKNTSTLSRIMEKLDEEETQINDLAIKLGLPLFCLTILLLFIVPTLIKRNNPPLTTEVSSQNVLLEISTVLLLTMTILILGLSGKIQSDVLGTLIGGISGYVLNRIRTRSDAPAET